MSSDQPVSFEEDWERRSEEILDETEYDTELGMDLAKDAQQVVAGEMSEQAFHEKYHDAVVEEFGEDERELDGVFGEIAAADDPDGLRGKLEGLFDDDVSRREMMKAGGVAAMGLSLAAGEGTQSLDDENGAGGAESASSEGEEGTRWGMVINLDNCDGCLQCVTACKSLHGSSRGSHWIYVMAYQDPEVDQDHENFFVRTCQHCGNAPCEKVCPVGARHTRDKDGLVLTDYDICIGCRYCMVSCPYGANYFQWGEPDTPKDDEDFTHDERGKWVDGPPPSGAMGKCTFEPAWQDGAMGENMVGTTMCEQACTRDAIHFGDMNDPESAPNQHIEEYKAKHENDLSEFENRNPTTVSTFKALDDRGTDPGIVFIGKEPSVHAEQVEGPKTYEEMGLIDNRKKEVLDEGAAANAEGDES